MSNKRQQIIETSMRLFASHGYHSTSMQRIADKLNMAKGSLYLHFTSKEQLLISILEHYHNEMFTKVAHIAEDPSLSPKEKLIKQIDAQFTGFQKNGDFVKMNLKEHLNQEIKAVSEYMDEFRAKMLLWHKHVLLVTYGTEINPYLWDLVMIFSSMMREYMMLLVFEKMSFETTDVALFIAERLDGIVCDVIKHQPHPIISPDQVARAFRFNDKQEQGLYKRKQILAKGETIKEILKSAPFEKSEQEELYAAVDFLMKESSKDSRQVFMMKAILNELAQITGIQKQVNQLKSLIM